jgi:hypothetical protein
VLSSLARLIWASRPPFEGTGAGALVLATMVERQGGVASEQDRIPARHPAVNRAGIARDLRALGLPPRSAALTQEDIVELYEVMKVRPPALARRAKLETIDRASGPRTGAML